MNVTHSLEIIYKVFTLLFILSLFLFMQPKNNKNPIMSEIL